MILGQLKQIMHLLYFSAWQHQSHCIDSSAPSIARMLITGSFIKTNFYLDSRDKGCINC